MSKIKWYRTKRGLIYHIHSGQRERNQAKFGCLPEYTRDELYDALMVTPKFHDLFNAWVVSGYDKMLRPSIDRKDNLCGYTYENVQLMTWQQNYDKESSDRSNTKAVIKMDMDGNHICEYPSIKAAQADGFSQVSRVCNGKRKSCHGFTFKFKRI